MNVIWLIVSGLISGIVGGMGMGGGTLLIPILSIFFAFVQQQAQGINLFVFIPMSIIAVIIHFNNKLIDYKVALPFIICGIFSSVLASLLANSISSQTLKVIFGIFLIIIGIIQTIQTIFNFLKPKTLTITNKITLWFKK